MARAEGIVLGFVPAQELRDPVELTNAIEVAPLERFAKLTDRVPRAYGFSNHVSRLCLGSGMIRLLDVSGADVRPPTADELRVMRELKAA